MRLVHQDEEGVARPEGVHGLRGQERRARRGRFPQQEGPAPDTKKQNDDLKKQYKVNGFPTFVLIDADGKELGRQVGYLKGGPDAFIAKIGEWKKASK